MPNLTRKLDDAVRNDIDAARLLVDLIQNPSHRVPRPRTGGAQDKSSNG